MFRRSEELQWDVGKIITPDLDHLTIRVSRGRENAPMVLFVHGLEGSYRSPLFSNLAKQLIKKGWRVVALSLRGSDEQNPGPLLYTAGDSFDLDLAIRWLKGHYQPFKLDVLAISLGANTLGKWLGQKGDGAKEFVDSAIMISPPVDLYESSMATQKAMFGFYDRIFFEGIKASCNSQSYSVRIKRMDSTRKYFRDTKY